MGAQGQLGLYRNSFTDTWDLGLTEDSGEQLALDYGLRTAITISLLTERRATPEQALDPSDLRGWFGDSHPPDDDPTFVLGSYLWTLRGHKTTQDTLDLAKDYCTRALQWLVADGWVESFDVEVTRVATTVLAANIVLRKPKNAASDIALRWELSL